ncbi:hypothetical protein AAG570_012290 [Ranatra chinensis]|uniref:Uncharacterized protein n=1 Tax=Ranatra chinensis TaxID=642074 RepID=A0ABD0Z0M2_9HEMI
MASKHRNTFYQNKKQEATEIGPDSLRTSSRRPPTLLLKSAVAFVNVFSCPCVSASSLKRPRTRPVDSETSPPQDMYLVELGLPTALNKLRASPEMQCPTKRAISHICSPSYACNPGLK